MVTAPTDPITHFEGPHRWLSNFWPVPLAVGNDSYSSLEHAYQACKTTDPRQRERIRNAPTAGEAKRRGRTITVRDDWQQRKLTVMYRLLRQKFGWNASLRRKLLATGDRELIETNTWGDTFWGVSAGAGHNHLGRLLMQVRAELRALEQEAYAQAREAKAERQAEHILVHGAWRPSDAQPD